MKSILDRQERAITAESRFPILAKLVDSNKVVLFTSLKTGVVLIPDNDHKVGDTADWVDVDKPEIWEVLPGGTEVRLVQE